MRMNAFQPLHLGRSIISFNEYNGITSKSRHLSVRMCLPMEFPLARCTYRPKPKEDTQAKTKAAPTDIAWL